MKDKNYLISVVIPIYNVKDYLEATIKSIIKQTIGFENIELILVNDGSPYGEETICKKYDAMYDNVIYINQDNAGVSQARNNGLKQATGKYINFIDSDDKLEKDAYEKAIKMLDENPDINVVGLRLKFFEAAKGYHVTDYRFDKGDRIVDIQEDYSALQLSAASSIIRKSALKGIEFDSTLKYSEDAKFITEVLFKNKTLKYGLLKSTNYLYRRRRDRASSIQNQTYDKKWYTHTCEKVYEYVMELSKKTFGEIIPYAQYFAAYHLQFRINKAIDINFTKEEIEEYNTCLKRLLDKIQDYILLEQREIPLDNKLQILNLKYEQDSSKHIIVKDNKIYYKNTFIQNLGDYEVSLVNIKEEEKNLLIGLLIDTFLNEKDISIKTSTDIQDITYSKTDIKLCENYQEYFPNKKMISILVPKKDNQIQIKYKGIKLLFTGVDLFQILSNSYNYYKNDKIILTIHKRKLSISKSIPTKLKNKLIGNIYMLLFYPRQAATLFLSNVLKKKYNDATIAYVFDKKTIEYIKENIKNKNIYYISSTKEDSTINKRSFKYKMLLLNSKNIYVNFNDINRLDVNKPFGHATKMYVNKLNPTYNIITNRKLSKLETDTLKIKYKKVNIINIK